MTFRIPRHISDTKTPLFPAEDGAYFLIAPEARKRYLAEIKSGKVTKLMRNASAEKAGKPYSILYADNKCFVISHIKFVDKYSHTKLAQNLETGDFVEIRVMNKSQLKHEKDAAEKFYREPLPSVEFLQKGKGYLISPFNYGFSFRRHIHNEERDARQPQHMSEKVDMALELVYAVEKLHKNNLVHNDIRSRTCIYDPRAIAKSKVSFSKLYTVRQEEADLSSFGDAVDEDIFRGEPHKDPNLSERNTKASDCYSIGVLLSRIFHLGAFEGQDDFENGRKIEREKLQESNTKRPWLFETKIEKIIREEVILNLVNADSQKRDLEKAKTALEGLKNKLAYNHAAALKEKTVNWQVAAPLLVLSSVSARMMFLPVGEKPGFEAFCGAVRNSNGEDYSDFVDKFASDVSFCAIFFVVAVVAFACFSYYQTNSDANAATTQRFLFREPVGQGAKGLVSAVGNHPAAPALRT